MGTAPMAPPPRPSLEARNGNKRRRLGEHDGSSLSARSSVASAADTSMQEEDETPHTSDNNEEEEYYNPNQDPEQRRRAKQKIRAEAQRYHGLFILNSLTRPE
jgi:hypothetical protein